MIAEVDTDNNKTIEFEEFLQMMKKVKASGGKVVSQFASVRDLGSPLRLLNVCRL